MQGNVFDEKQAAINMRNDSQDVIEALDDKDADRLACLVEIIESHDWYEHAAKEVMLEKLKFDNLLKIWENKRHAMKMAGRFVEMAEKALADMAA